MKTISIISCLFALFLTGCWTISETEYPTAVVPSGKGIRVWFETLKAGKRHYCPVEDHLSMSDDGSEALSDDAMKELLGSSWLLRRTASGMLVMRTISELKRKGFEIDAEKPQYIINLTFSDPILPDNDALRQVGYAICTIFTAENMILTRTAQLNVLDAATKKVLYSKEFEQTYDATVWGPIPIASPACNDKVTFDGADSWVQTALTDCAIADATTFIVGRH